MQWIVAEAGMWGGIRQPVMSAANISSVVARKGRIYSHLHDIENPKGSFTQLLADRIKL